MRKIPFIDGEFYHIYNRGVDKRNIFSDKYDIARFFQSMDEFNTREPIGSIYENSFNKKQLGNPTSKLSKFEGGKSERLVDFICYCLNPNHFHFILRQVSNNGVSNFIKRLSGGYAKYFNEKYARSGTLFQGRFKAIHINSNNYLLHLSAYVNLNDRVHQLGNPTSKLTSKLVRSRSSWEEYRGGATNGFCKKDIVLNQFNTINEYKIFAEESLEDILHRRNLAGMKIENMETYLLE